ncbi:MAG: tetratricopeptide repeat protein, partial [Armatimonadetes bacterium]|nr:tetratricopeptide repeat protein [Armatimonadota bacterium]
MATALRADKNVALSQSLAVRGTGGIGKTQLALQYAHRYMKEYQWVIWVRASDTTTLYEDYRKIAAQVIGIPANVQITLDDLFAHIDNWCKTHDNWLMALDNVDDPQSVQDYLPDAGRGHLLITTRQKALGNLAAEVLEIGKMTTEEGLKLLYEWSKTPESVRQIPTEKQSAETLITELGGLPLAIAQAGAYMQNGMPPSKFLALFRKHSVQMLSQHATWSEKEHPAVLVTFQLSLESLDSEGDLGQCAKELLRLAAFYSPDGFPIALFERGASALSEALRNAVQDDLMCEELLALLVNKALVEREGDTLIVHRLIQAVQRHLLGEEQKSGLEDAVAVVSSSNLYTEDFHNWKWLEQLVATAQACYGYIKAMGAQTGACTHILNQFGLFLNSKGRYGEAEPLFLEGLAIRRKSLPEGHPQIAGSLNNLAGLYRSQGRYGEAEPLFLEGLAIGRKSLPEGHPQIAGSLNN